MSQGGRGGAEQPTIVIQQRASHIPLLLVGLALIALLGLVLVLGGLFVLSAVSREAAGRGKRLRSEFFAGEERAAARAAMIPVVGVLSDEEPDGIFGRPEPLSQRLKRQLDRADRDRVRALLLWINSPGGAIGTTQRLHRLLLDWKREHPGVPVVAFLDEVAASGGYYMATAADWVVALPSSITASIGVLLVHYNLQGLLEGKLGVRIRAYRSGAQKDILSPWRAMTPEEDRHLQGIVAEAYEAFLDAVVEGRRGKVEREALRALESTILTGKQALARGLVDQVGFFEDAVAKAAELAGVEALRVVRYVRPPGLLEQLFEAAGGRRAAPRWDTVGLLRRGVPCLYLWQPGL